MNTQILEEIKALKKKLLPNEKLILFGSQVRGDTHEESDWDLLVLLNKEKKTFEDEDMYGFPFDKIGWNYGVAINTMIYSTKEWEKRKITPFYKNVVEEGIEIN